MNSPPAARSDRANVAVSSPVNFTLAASVSNASTSLIASDFDPVSARNWAISSSFCAAASIPADANPITTFAIPFPRFQTADTRPPTIPAIFS